MISVVSLVALLLAAPSPVPTSTPAASAAASARVKSLKILVLSTMLADEGIGEWGFSALVEVDGHRILFDTGARPTTVLENARELKVDLAGVPEVVLSHNHSDHTGGLLTLRRDAKARDEAALTRVHVGRGLFWSRPTAEGAGESNLPLKTRADYAAAGLTFIEHDSARQILPGVWLTGPVPRVHPERNWSGKGRVRTPEGLVEDTIPEDLSLVLDTERGLVVVSGCGHAGIVNTVEYARKIVRPAPVHAIVGGLHLYALDDERLNWTADQLEAAGLENLMGAHCTGLEAVYRIRQRAGLDRKTAVVGAVGSSFVLGQGIDPRDLAR
ncbi:MAG TPA: MBL fold metallo-hydrolase [Vicinamibacteria bacterium]|nr:MBL fold metallo-hydrolase [Vicinamibacteria bacterium]